VKGLYARAFFKIAGLGRALLCEPRRYLAGKAWPGGYLKECPQA
jgi:hypothetical protein